MRHHNSNRKFSRKSGQRAALKKSLALAILTKGKIKTTEAKAKDMRPYVEKLITKAKNSTSRVTAMRTLQTVVGKDATKKLLDVIAPKYKDVKGGYTRITKLPKRLSDGSSMAVIELV